MFRAVALLLVGFLGQASAQMLPVMDSAPLGVAMCAAGGGTYMPNGEVPEIGNCDMTIWGMLGDFAYMSELTDEQCHSIVVIPDLGNYSLLFLLRNIHAPCCSGDMKENLYGPCGDYYDGGKICSDPAHFRPYESLPRYHCNGDENIGYDACWMTGECNGVPCGWDEDWQECDVGRTDNPEAMCGMVGGSWEQHTCMNEYNSLEMSGFSTEIFCMGHMSHWMYETAAGCCKHDDGTAAPGGDMCAGILEATDTLKEYFCDGMGSFDDTYDLAGDGTTCGDFYNAVFRPFGSQTSMTPEQCNALVPESDTTHAVYVLIMQGRCCGSSRMSTHGVCGENFPQGNACMHTADFDSNRDMNLWHCLGDEMANETVCRAAAEGAWDASQEEKCDIGRAWQLTEDERKAACTQVGGTVMPYKCIDFMMHFTMNTDMSYDQVCQPEHMGLWNMVGEECCWNPEGEKTMAKQPCDMSNPPPAPSPMPPPMGSCGTISRSLHSRMLAAGFKPSECSGDNHGDARMWHYRFKVCDDNGNYWQGKGCKTCGDGYHCAEIQSEECQEWQGPYPTGCHGPEHMSWMQGHNSVMITCEPKGNGFGPKFTSYSGYMCEFDGQPMDYDWKEFCWDEGDGDSWSYHSNLGYMDCPVR